MSLSRKVGEWGVSDRHKTDYSSALSFKTRAEKAEDEVERLRGKAGALEDEIKGFGERMKS